MEKLLIITPSLAADDLSQYLFWQLSQLKRIYDIQLVEHSPSVDIHTVLRQQLIAALPQRFASLSSPVDVLEMVKDFSPHVIHFHEFPERFCDFALLKHIYHPKRAFKLVETTHSPVKIEKKFLPDKFVFVSPFSCKMYDDLKTPFQIVEYPTFYKIRPQREVALAKLGLPTDRRHVLNIGPFVSYKNQREIFELAYWLPDYDFHFIGRLQKNLEDVWRPLVDKKPANCHIHGEREDIEAWYAACDLFLFPSEIELDPLTVKDAFGWGMKVAMKNLPTYLNRYVESANLRFLSTEKATDATLIRSMLETEASNNLFSFTYDVTQRKKEDVSIVLLFTKGPNVEIKGDIGVPFQVTFFNKTTGQVEYDGLLRGNDSVQAGAAYYQDWKIIVKQQDRVFLDYDLNLNNANVFISHESQGFGDNLAWMPYVDEFRKRHHCNVTCQTAFPELFEKVYPEIKFINAGGVAENIFAHFRLGCYRPTEKDKVFSPPIEWWKHPLQEIVKHQLGLTDLGEIRPKVYFDETQDIHKDMKDFVCIATRSTMRCKEWQNTKGWLSLTRWLRSKGLGVVNISRKGMELEGVQNVADDESFQSIMSYLRHSKFLIGLSSGLSWLAWALHKQVVIINGFANPIPEFSDAIHVGSPPNVCTGCYQHHMLDIFDFDWCPEDQNFNCTRTITPEMVQAKVEPLL